MKTSFKPAFRYQFVNFLKSAAVFYLIIVVITTAFLIVSVHFAADSSMSFTGNGNAFAIGMFVVAIVYIRSDLRLCLQFGVSRRTAFISEILAVLSVSAILAVAGELLTAITQVVVLSNPNSFVGDVYQLIYMDAARVLPTFGQHMLSALINTGMFFCASLIGMFFSLLFWRLNKLWTIVVAIAIPFAINGVPILLVRLGFNLNPFIEWIASSPFCFALTSLTIAAAAALIDWLLLRRANIKARK